MNNYYPCRACDGTMNGRYCMDCGFDEMEFINEWDEFTESLDNDQEQEAA